MMKVTTYPLSGQGRRVRFIKLILFVSPVIGAYFYSYTNYASPLFCPIKALTGIPCPGCGMTRSFMSIAQGNLQQAINYNFFGLFLFAGFSLATVHLMSQLMSQRQMKGIYKDVLPNNSLKLGLLLSILVYHSLRLYFLLESGQLMIQFKHSPVGNFLL